MHENKRSGSFRDFLKEKGYYIALILCVAAIGISGYLYYRNTSVDPQPGQEALSATDGAATAPVSNTGKDDAAVSVIATKPQAAAPQDTTPSTVATQPKKLATMYPVEGEAVGAYAMEELSYNETTRDWRVHNGIDLAAPAGTDVVAAADGVVYTIYTDDSIGTTIVLQHDGGYTTKYASLQEEVAVAVGDTVKMGDTLGQVGVTALTETALGDHVHFAVACDGKSVDPMEFLEQ